MEEKNDRSVRVECRPRSSSRRTRKPNDHSYSRVRESSETRSKERSKTRSKSAKSRHRESPPDDSSDSSDMEEDRRRDRDRRRNRPRRRGDPSPDGDGSGDDSSTDGDETETRTISKHFRIKLQKFDGTGSWESWWAHFQNCASYNKWTKRDKLAFIKGALTGSASQVLWDTDRSITDSLTKLVEVLKSRYGGERQAEKHRAELQLRCRKTDETLSDLHHDIRRLTVLAYPKLSAEAREEIACDRFTDALGDPDFALKVKERAPKSLDEALCIALRLEAWAKSVKRDRPEDDRPDRSDRGRQKVRFAAKPETPKKTCVLNG